MNPLRSLRFSFPLGFPLFVFPALLVLARGGSDRWWGYLAHGAYLLLILLFVWVALNPGQFQRIQARDPTLTRGTWLFNWLLFFVGLPFAAWLVFGLRYLI